jgi:hypothetical protein
MAAHGGGQLVSQGEYFCLLFECIFFSSCVIFILFR